MPDHWWRSSSPMELKRVPWIPPAATEYLESILEPDWYVIEHGSGGSTVWMAERVKKVNAFENNPKWLKVVQEAAPPNVEFGKKSKRKCDLLFLDGEPLEERREWIANAVNLVKAGGWIVLDNANRNEYKAERDALAEFADLVHRVDGNEQTREVTTFYLVTEFWQVRK